MTEIVELIRTLVGFPTLHSRKDDIAACADFIETFLKDNDIAYRRMDHQDVPSILAGARDDFAPVLLMSHIDVVDAPESLFTPREENGKLYGRGTLDDKYAVALSLLLFRDMLADLKAAGKSQREMPFGILITGDEEIGGRNGAAKALETFRTDFGIALDGGHTNSIIVKEKGIFQLKLVGRGKAAHGSRPWKGENAIENLMDDFRIIKSFFEPSALPYPHENHWHRTLNLGVITAGKSANQVPDYAEALLDIRFTEHDDMDALLTEMNAAIRGELTLHRRGDLFRGGDSPYLDLLLSLVPEAATDIEHGASDARHLSKHGIPGIVWGADGDASYHALDEHVDIASLATLYGRLRRFMEAVMAREAPLSGSDAR